MRLAVKNVPLDPVPVLDGRIAYDARGACNSARRNRPSDLHHRMSSPAPARFQVAPVSRGANGGAARRTHKVACGKTGARPTCLMDNLMPGMMLRRRTREAAATQH